MKISHEKRLLRYKNECCACVYICAAASNHDFHRAVVLWFFGLPTLYTWYCCYTARYCYRIVAFNFMIIWNRSLCVVHTHTLTWAHVFVRTHVYSFTCVCMCKQAKMNHTLHPNKSTVSAQCMHTYMFVHLCVLLVLPSLPSLFHKYQSIALQLANFWIFESTFSANSTKL